MGTIAETTSATDEALQTTADKTTEEAASETEVNATEKANEWIGG